MERWGEGAKGHGVKVTRWRGVAVTGCWGGGGGRMLGWRGGVVAGSRAAHDALSEAARNNDLLALLIHLGATRALTLERRHLQLHSWQGRLLASMHSAAQETGKRPEDGRRTCGRLWTATAFAYRSLQAGPSETDVAGSVTSSAQLAANVVI